MKRLIGFVLGVLVVTGIWYSRGGFENVTAERTGSTAFTVRDRAVQQTKIVTRTETQQDKTGDMQDKADDIQGKGADMQIKADDIQGKGADMQDNAVDVEDKIVDKQHKAADKDEEKASGSEEPPGTAASDTESPQQDRHALSPGKQFFWQPFQLESRARGFAGYIEEKSGVVCKCEKQEPGIYQVYFPYTDDTDRDGKIKRIEKTGINLHIN